MWCDGTAATYVYMSSENIPITFNDGNDWSQNYRGELGHIDGEMWAETDNGQYDVYAETGVILAEDYANRSYKRGYWLFWSDENPSYGQYTHFYTTVPENGSSQGYTIYELSFTTWGIWNSTYGTFGQSTHQSGVYSWNWSSGIEEYDGDSDYSGALVDPDEWTGSTGISPTFNNTIQVYNGSSWHSPTDTAGRVFSGSGASYGCTSTNLGYCMNGTTYGPGNWAANIPG
jgi:hypothetical protein